MSDFKETVAKLSKNKYAVAGVIGAAGVGLYVFVKNRNKPTTADGTDATSATALPGIYSTGAGGSGSLDTTGTDVASYLSNYSASLQNQLDAYQSQLTGALSGISSIPTAGAPATASVITRLGASDANALAAKYTAPGNKTWFSIAQQFFGSSATQKEAAELAHANAASQTKNPKGSIIIPTTLPV
jgi:hypothetical protein